MTVSNILNLENGLVPPKVCNWRGLSRSRIDVVPPDVWTGIPFVVTVQFGWSSNCDGLLA